jgi:hypothetical protein
MSEYVRERIDTGAAVLWACAFVLIAMIITQASRLGGAPAQARSAVAVEDMVVITAGTAANDDVLVVLDQRSDRLYVYGIENQRLRLFDGRRVNELFEQASRGGGSR